MGSEPMAGSEERLDTISIQKSAFHKSGSGARVVSQRTVTLVHPLNVHRMIRLQPFTKMKRIVPVRGRFSSACVWRFPSRARVGDEFGCPDDGRASKVAVIDVTRDHPPSMWFCFFSGLRTKYNISRIKLCVWKYCLMLAKVVRRRINFGFSRN